MRVRSGKPAVALSDPKHCVRRRLHPPDAERKDEVVAHVNIGSRRELFVDYTLIDRLEGARLRLHRPDPREVVLRHDAPWEGPFCLYHTVVRDADRYLLYYRGWQDPKGPAVYCLAESGDGLRFSRPSLGMHTWDGNTHNNIVLAEEPYTHTFAPFVDTRPGVPDGQRFKAFSRNFIGPKSGENAVLNAFVSGDGLEWKLLSREPVITDGIFDSQNVGFWSETEQRYVAYYRTFSAVHAFASAATGPTTTAERLRSIMRASSEDFVHWQPGTLMDYRTEGRPAPVEEFYINQTRPYFRAPHIYVALPARFMAGRRAITEEEADAVGVHTTQRKDSSDACFMTTRPGQTWYDRTFMEAFVRPGVGPSHWSGRCNYPADGVVQTGAYEMSFYVNEHYAQPGNQLRRYSLRLDGFSSCHAPHAGGELLTKPLVFSGSELELNYETGAAGSLRVEICDVEARPIPGYTLADAVDVFGNRIAGRACWTGGADVSRLAGTPVRLRFVMRDADLYSIRFLDTGA